jgi:hypothetical protein
MHPKFGENAVKLAAPIIAGTVGVKFGGAAAVAATAAAAAGAPIVVPVALGVAGVVGAVVAIKKLTEQK